MLLTLPHLAKEILNFQIFKYRSWGAPPLSHMEVCDESFLVLRGELLASTLFSYFPRTLSGTYSNSEDNNLILLTCSSLQFGSYLDSLLQSIFHLQQSGQFHLQNSSHPNYGWFKTPSLLDGCIILVSVSGICL